jgi:PAS domain S-box-containing protein
MKKAPIPHNEKERLEELRRYEVLDTAQEKIFDDITELARTICRTKICVISLVDQDRQWFKSVQGLEARETPRDVSFCGHAIHHEEIFEIENSLADERFKDNPLCVSAPNVIFYAGAPLITPQGFKIGTLCVIDDKPGKLDPTQRQLLQQLSKQVINYLELQRKEMELQLSHIKLDRIVNHIPVILALYNEKGEFQWCNKAWERELGWGASEMRGRDMLVEFYPDPIKRQEVLNFMMQPGQGWREFRLRTKSGDYIFTSWANVSLPNGWTVGIGKNIDENVIKVRKPQSFSISATR